MGTRKVSLPGADNCGDDASNKQQQWLLSLLKRDNETDLTSAFLSSVLLAPLSLCSNDSIWD